MRALILVIFWLFVVRAAIRFLCLAMTEYPRTAKIEAGIDVWHGVLAAGLACWCAYVLWGAQ